jgi:hypothetical protein
MSISTAVAILHSRGIDFRPVVQIMHFLKFTAKPFKVDCSATSVINIGIKLIAAFVVAF